jgi:hypothetical protein
MSGAELSVFGSSEADLADKNFRATSVATSECLLPFFDFFLVGVITLAEAVVSRKPQSCPGSHRNSFIPTIA